MREPLILHIETATDVCSVAISEGDQLLALVESGQERSHATLLNRFIREALEKAGTSFQDLQAVAISKGPGSYTGLRIGVSTAKGLAYALEIPLLSCGTLLSMAHGAIKDPFIRELAGKAGNNLLLCPMLDARRMEVYAAFYTTAYETVREVSADIIDEQSYADLLKDHPICFFGNGSEKCRKVIQSPHAHFLEDRHPSAQHMIEPVLSKFRQNDLEDVAYFEPFYLKDFVATIPRKKVL
jgi:tRNA threonylcarbamoyladenosine biosynthesis protein TsaB